MISKHIFQGIFIKYSQTDRKGAGVITSTQDGKNQGVSHLGKEGMKVQKSAELCCMD